jgi:hypothetical protein
MSDVDDANLMRCEIGNSCWLLSRRIELIAALKWAQHERAIILRVDVW